MSEQCRSSVGAVSIDTGVDGVGGVWPVSDRCLRVVGQGDAWVVSERVGVSSVGVSSVSEVSGVSDVSDRRTCVLGLLDLCPGIAGAVSWLSLIHI